MLPRGKEGSDVWKVGIHKQAPNRVIHCPCIDNQPLLTVAVGWGNASHKACMSMHAPFALMFHAARVCIPVVHTGGHVRALGDTS